MTHPGVTRNAPSRLQMSAEANTMRQSWRARRGQRRRGQRQWRTGAGPPPGPPPSGHRRRHRFSWLSGVVKLAIFLAILALYPILSLITYVWVGPMDETTVEARVAHYTNVERRDRGLRPLQYDQRIADIARRHSQNTLDTGEFAHEIDGKDPSDRAKASGYSCGLGENIFEHHRPLFGDEDAMAQALVEGWMESPGHRKNILTPDYRNIGVGVVVHLAPTEAVHATQNFSSCGSRTTAASISRNVGGRGCASLAPKRPTRRVDPPESAA